MTDWVVIGGGITGSALAYELAVQGATVTLIEQHAPLQGGTRFGYGGVAFWAGTSALTRQLCAAGRERLRSLADELKADIQWRELDLVLTIAAGADPTAVAQSYTQFAIPPQLVDRETAWELEPLLNREAIAGALTVKHGHVHLGRLATAYRQALVRLGGQVVIASVEALAVQPEQTGVLVTTPEATYRAEQVAVCAGALSRALLKRAGVAVPLYFTHAELIETPPLEVSLRSLVMPATTTRFDLEAEASKPENDALWDEPGHEPFPPILDAGAIQFLDGHLRIGQISRTLTDPAAPIDAQHSERLLREQVGIVLPALETVPGTWHRCLVAFSRDRLPLIGALPTLPGVHLFSGFSNPLAIVTPLAQRFAQAVGGAADPIIEQLSPNRFAGAIAPPPKP